jgi:hypothetical protein
MNALKITFDHQELVRDYAGYAYIQADIEAAITQFLQLYYYQLLKLYNNSEFAQIETFQVYAAGAGASKFVFGVFGMIENTNQWIFALRMYSNVGKMRDDQKIYASAEEYKTNLETHDQKLVTILIDEIKLYQEFAQKAQTSITIRGIWSRFPLEPSKPIIDSEHLHYLQQFSYIEDRELKRLLVNLGINAITVGDFIVGYDGRKILERREFQGNYKITAILHICCALLQSWLFTVQYNHKREIVGRTIVDLKPAQFVIQADDIKTQNLLPAVIIDVGPAENTDDISTFCKNITYMKELIPAFASEMLKKVGLTPADCQPAKQSIYSGIINYLNHCQETNHQPENIHNATFLKLINEFITLLTIK